MISATNVLAELPMTDELPAIVLSEPVDRLALEGRLLCINQRFQNEMLGLLYSRHQIDADRVMNLQITHFGFADDDEHASLAFAAVGVANDLLAIAECYTDLKGFMNSR
jgi:hypothetical protein